MKKNFKYAILSAIALVGTVGFSACSSSDELEDVNPTYDGASVHTDFSFNINMGGAKTRMSSDNTQFTGNFRGMQDMYLFPFATAASSTAPTNASTTNAANFPLGSLANSALTTTSSKTYSLTIPVGTNNFLFYAKADRASKTNAKVGALTSTIDENTTKVEDITFSLNPIAETLGTDGTNLVTYLNAVANAKGTFDVDGDTNNDDVPWVWTVQKSESDGNYASLAQLYNKFTTVPTGEARSGSVENISRLMLDLYRSAKAIEQQSSNAGVVAIAQGICTAITTAAGGITVTIDDTNTDPNEWTVALSGAVATFPADLGLPMGAAQLTWTVGNSSATLTSCSPATVAYNPSPLYAGGESSSTVTLGNIDFPAELVYFDNSPLIASDKYMQTGDYPDTAEEWDAALGSDGGFSTMWTKDSEVKASTRAIAMQNNVNYGVAVLQTTAKLDGAVLDGNGDVTATTGGVNLTDNMEAIVGGSDQVNIDGSAFKVTGILVGGQPAHVEWDMTHTRSKNGSDEWVSNQVFENVIYDKDVQFGTNLTDDDPDNDVLSPLTTAANTISYTIVLDNYTTATPQNKVLVALELKNGNQDFYGKYNLIPANSTFYLVGELDPTGKSFTPATRESTYRVTNENVARVFVQDYKTVANFTLKKESLKNAYSTIPDLTSSQVVFGLSVDLTWENGISFDVEIPSN